MKAIVCTRYGPPEVLQVQEVEQPTLKDYELRIKIFATAVTASDCIVRSCRVSLRFWLPMRLVLGMTRPRNPVLGLMFAGEVESVGKSVSLFRNGDQVFGLTIKTASRPRFGTYAEYKCLPEDSLVALKPANVTYEEAAALPYGAGLAWHYLTRANVKSGQRVLIYGASGAIGTAAVQLAKYFGATVTGVCSTANLELVRSLGADIVIDYTSQDSTRLVETYDVIFDAVGSAKTSGFKSACRKATTPNGTYVSVDDGSPRLRLAYLMLVKEMVEAGKMRAVIDRCYPLEHIVEAHRYVDTGHKRGNVVITVVHDAS